MLLVRVALVVVVVVLSVVAVVAQPDEEEDDGMLYVVFVASEHWTVLHFLRCDAMLLPSYR